ncbi:MAG: proteasome assembly chaperone family protein [Methanobacteriaceae archaeon]|jgi:hypothetical protein|nr:proteasome assembly chaperone family protein [Methanobacteriaceae archaeon]
MSSTEINVIEEIELDNPILIEALPGIGHVGKLAVDSMIDELEATKFAEIYSPYFPPQIFIGEEGMIENMINELYYLKDFGENKQDFIFLVGNTQGVSSEGQYEICMDILNYLEKFNINTMYTLGGIATGQPVENPKILGAATDVEMVEFLKESDIEIRYNDGGIIGASGLFLGLGKRKGIVGACLMGETPGYFIDAEAAEAILIKLSDLLSIEVNTEKLDERAEETRKMLEKAQQMEQEMMNKSSNQDVDDLRYIG